MSRALQFPVQRSEHAQIEHEIVAGLETGNLDHAATVMGVYAKEHPEKAAALRAKLSRDYGTTL